MAKSGIYFFNALKEIELRKPSTLPGRTMGDGFRYERGLPPCFYIKIEDVVSIEPFVDAQSNQIVGTRITLEGKPPKSVFQKPAVVFAALGIEVPDAFKSYYGIEPAPDRLNAEFEGASKEGGCPSNSAPESGTNDPTRIVPQP